VTSFAGGGLVMEFGNGYIAFMKILIPLYKLDKEVNVLSVNLEKYTHL